MRSLAWSAFAVAVLVAAAFFIYAPGVALEGGKAADAPQTHDFEFTVERGALVSGPAALAVREGDTVRITVTSDAPDEAHIHGYDRAMDLAPGVPASAEFVADMSGRFDIELHESGLELGALEVRP